MRIPKLLVDRKSSSLSRTNKINRYEGFVKEIPKSLAYESADSRYNMPGSVNFEFMSASIPTPPPPPPTDCSSAGYWINTINISGGESFYPYSVHIDDSCNVYTFSQRQSGSSYADYAKFNPSGESTVWNISTLYTSGSTSQDLCELRVSPSGDLYAIFESGIRKISSVDGSTIWEKFWNSNLNFTFSGVVFDNSGSLFVNASGNSLSYIAKLSESDGSVLAQKEIGIDGINNPYSNTPALIDSDNNVILGIAGSSNIDGEYITPILKLSNNLSSQIWISRVDPVPFGGNDLDITGFGIDENDNLYGLNYGNSIFKMDSNGEYVWGLTMNLIDSNYMYCLATAPNGDTYWVGDIYPGDVGISGSYDVLTIVKFDTSASLQWAVAVQDPNSQLAPGSWNISNDVAEISKGSLLINAYKSDNNTSAYLKLQTNQIPTGSFGDYIITDITNVVSASMIYSTADPVNYTFADTNIFATTTSAIFTSSSYAISFTNTSIS
jgi:hypothetical protein